MNRAAGTVAFTTTIPVEVILAAGRRPLDLNNIFISDPRAAELVEKAESAGFPRSCCAWIKGLFSVLRDRHRELGITAFVAVTEGDCSNAKVLKELIEREIGLPATFFSFPQDRSVAALQNEIERLAAFLGTTLADAEKARQALRPVRKALEELDELSWRHPGLVSGTENHRWLVSASDFNGAPVAFEKELRTLLATKEAKVHEKRRDLLPLAYLGVPPIVDLYPFIEEKGAIVIFNEMQREFSMPGEFPGLAEQYAAYTYPYSAAYRFEKALAEIRRRGVRGIIHYVQSFCHRQLEDIILRRMVAEAGLKVPVLTLEGDKPQRALDGRTRTRVEAFIEML